MYYLQTCIQVRSSHGWVVSQPLSSSQEKNAFSCETFQTGLIHIGWWASYVLLLAHPLHSTELWVIPAVPWSMGQRLQLNASHCVLPISLDSPSVCGLGRKETRRKGGDKTVPWKYECSLALQGWRLSGLNWRYLYSCITGGQHSWGFLAASNGSALFLLRWGCLLFPPFSPFTKCHLYL